MGASQLADRKLTRELNRRYRTLALCLAMGMQLEEAAAQTGIPAELAQAYERDPRFQIFYEKFCEDIEQRVIEQTADKRAKALMILQSGAEQAASKVVSLMNNAFTESVQLKAATGILKQSGIDLDKSLNVVDEEQGDRPPSTATLAFQKLHEETIASLEAGPPLLTTSEEEAEEEAADA